MNPEADLTLKVELKTELIEQILYNYVKERFPEIPAGYAPGKVRFVINHSPTDMRGELMGSHTLGKAIVEITHEVKPSKTWENYDR